MFVVLINTQKKEKTLIRKNHQNCIEKAGEAMVLD